MKNILGTILIALLILLSACSDSTSPQDNASVIVRSQLLQNTAKFMKGGKDYPKIQQTEVDSIKFTEVRILLSEIKFHDSNEGDEGQDKVLKSGPCVFVGNESGSRIEVAIGTLPVGSYNKIKFEIHRFNNEEQDNYKNDITFSDFATNERHTVIIEGIAYKYNTAFPFVYKSSLTANQSLKFEPAVNFNENTSNIIVLQIDPANLMKIGNSLLDPRDADNKNDIDYLIQTAIKAFKL